PSEKIMMAPGNNPTLLDGWGNPVVYVPKPDLRRPSQGGVAWTSRYGLSTTDGGIVRFPDRPYPDEPDWNNEAEVQARLRELAEFKPFFVSGGPDENI